MERVEMFYILTTEIICAIGLGLWSLYLKLRFFNKCNGNMTQQQLKLLNTIEKQHNLLAENTQLLNNMKRQLVIYKQAIVARQEYCLAETRREIAYAHLSKLQAEEAQEDFNLVKDALDDVITKISEIRKIIYTDDRAAKKIPIIIRILEGEREEESERDAEVDEDYEEEKEY